MMAESAPVVPVNTPEKAPEELIVDMVFQALKAELTGQFNASMKELQEGLDAAYIRMMGLEAAVQGTQEVHQTLKIDLPGVYNGKSELLTD